MQRATLGRVTSLVGILVLAAACSPQPFIAPPSVPSQEPERLRTTVAQTAAAAQAQTFTALPPSNTPASPIASPTPSATPSRTPSPSPTVVFLFPTETLDPTLLLEPDTSEIFVAEGDGENGGEDEQKEEKRKYPTPAIPWKCEILSKSPAKGSVISPKTEFKARWVVKNTGTHTWPVKGVDVVFKTGARFHDRAYFDIPNSVSPGSTVVIEVTLTTDHRKDIFTTQWALRVGKNNFCTLPITIEVR